MNKSDMDADVVGAKQLACAVITRAIEDMQSKATHHNATSGNERTAAIAFLTERTGSWAASRQFWASLADIDPDLLAERASGLLA